MIYPKKPYKAWDINSEEYPSNSSFEEQANFMLGFAVLAPSTFNSQPWKYKIVNQTIEIYMDLLRVPTKTDKTKRFAYISLGCFIENLVVASTHYGWATDITYQFKSRGTNELVATIYLKKTHKKNEHNEKLFDNIRKRSTNRSFHIDKKVPSNVIDTIKNFTQKNQKFITLNKKNQKNLIAISQKADYELISNIEFRKEQIEWVRSNLTKKQDGMPGFGVGIPTIPSLFAKQMIMSPLFPKIQAKKNAKTLLNTSLYGVLLGNDGKEAWVQHGIFFEKTALFLTANKLVIAPLGQFIESDEARKELKVLTDDKSSLLPQLFLRIGYPTLGVKSSPRLSADSIRI